MKLTILHDEIDYSLKMQDLSGDERSIDLSVAPIYLGYNKPIKNFYLEVLPGTEDELSLEYFNGLAFTPVKDLEDASFGMSESGMIRFAETHAKESVIGGKKLFWLKLETTRLEEILVKGIGLVLSSDKDLAFVPALNAYLPNGSNSWIAFHQEATNQVIQYIRNSGKNVKKFSGNLFTNPRQVEIYDLLDIEEFKNAAKYYALHLIFDYISKMDGDPFSQKSVRYYEKYLENINDKLMSIDMNDNGVSDDGEKSAIQYTRIIRE